MWSNSTNLVWSYRKVMVIHARDGRSKGIMVMAVVEWVVKVCFCSRLYTVMAYMVILTIPPSLFLHSHQSYDNAFCLTHRPNTEGEIPEAMTTTDKDLPFSQQ